MRTASAIRSPLRALPPAYRPTDRAPGRLVDTCSRAALGRWQGRDFNVQWCRGRPRRRPAAEGFRLQQGGRSAQPPTGSHGRRRRRLCRRASAARCGLEPPCASRSLPSPRRKQTQILSSVSSFQVHLDSENESSVPTGWQAACRIAAPLSRLVSLHRLHGSLVKPVSCVQGPREAMTWAGRRLHLQARRAATTRARRR